LNGGAFHGETDRSEFILDNQADNVLPWFGTGYRFVKRQSQGNPNVWVSLGYPPGVEQCADRP
jgi:predicted transglutaminase-like cysteine proteinase